MYALTAYSIYNITPLSEVSPKDWKYLNIAAEVAERSKFDSALRLGACLEGKGRCDLCR